MPYSEQDGQVVLTMSKEDYEFLFVQLTVAVTAIKLRRKSLPELMWAARLKRATDFLNRLNSGNPHYTPYQTGEAKK